MIGSRIKNPLIIDPEDFDPLYDDVYEEDDEDQEDERGLYEIMAPGVKRRKPAINDDF